MLQNKNKKNKKTMEQEGDDDTSSNWCTWNDLQRIGKGGGRVGNKRSSKDHPEYSIKIGQTTKKSPEDLWRLAVTQTPARNNQLTLGWKTLKNSSTTTTTTTTTTTNNNNNKG